MAVWAWIPLSAFTLAIWTDTTILALSTTLFNFFINYLYIRAKMHLTLFSCPFKLQSALITGVVCGKLNFFSIYGTFFSSTREWAFLICWFIKRLENFKVIFINTFTQSYGTISCRWWVNNLPSDKVSWSRSWNEMNVSSTCSSTWLLW